MCAVKAIQHDIARHEQLAADEALGDDDLAYHGQKVLDLSAVLSEICRAYELAQAGIPKALHCPAARFFVAESITMTVCYGIRKTWRFIDFGHVLGYCLPDKVRRKSERCLSDG